MFRLRVAEQMIIALGARFGAGDPAVWLGLVDLDALGSGGALLGGSKNVYFASHPLFHDRFHAKHYSIFCAAVPQCFMRETRREGKKALKYPGLGGGGK